MAQDISLYEGDTPSGGQPESVPPSQVPKMSPQKPREPIFHQMPMGVATLIGIIITAHLAFFVQNPATQAAALATFALSPAQFAQDISAGNWISALSMLFG